jgi:uncharacterized delta-60 repeat protein
MAWSLGLLLTLLLFPWLVSGPSTILGIAGLAAVTTAYTDRREPLTLSPSTIVRYMLIDGMFVSCTLLPVFLFIQLALAAGGLSPRIGSMGYGHVLIFAFVCAFYLCLAVVNHIRSGQVSLRVIPLVAAAIVLGLLLFDASPRFIDYSVLHQARDAGVAAYEQTTGKHTDLLTKLRIGNSLHGFDNRVSTITIDHEGRLLVSGEFQFYAGKDARGLVRLLPDGQLDQSFASLPFGDPGLSAPSQVRITTDGSILINTTMRGTTISPMGLTRLRTDGEVDPLFQSMVGEERGDGTRFESMDMQPDGQIVVTAPIHFVQRVYDSCLLRFDSNGSIDTPFSFASMEALYGPVSSRPESITCSISKVTTMPTGHLLIEGSFPSTNHTTTQGIARLNPDGTRDVSYRPDLGRAEYSWSSIAPTGELYAVYYVPIPRSSPVIEEARCIKLRADGQPDPTFNIPPGRFLRIEHLAVQPDGKIIVTGSLGVNGYGAIVRLLPNGQPDPTFGGSEGVVHVDGFLRAIVVQTDGRIVLGGEFQQVTGAGKNQQATRHNIARLLPNGTIDPTLDPR